MQSKCKAMQSKCTRLVFVFILYNYLIINEAVVLFRYAVFKADSEGVNKRVCLYCFRLILFLEGAECIFINGCLLCNNRSKLLF